MLNLFKQIADYFSRKPREPRLIGDDGYIREYETDGFFGKSWTEMYILYECFRLFPEDIVAACACLYDDDIDTYRNAPIESYQSGFGQVVCKTGALLGRDGTIEERCAKFLAMAATLQYCHGKLPAVPGNFQELTERGRADWLYKNYCLERLSNAASAAR